LNNLYKLLFSSAIRVFLGKRAFSGWALGPGIAGIYLLSLCVQTKLQPDTDVLELCLKIDGFGATLSA